MAGKKPLTPAQFRKTAERRLKKQPRLMKGKAAKSLATARSKHYGKGSILVKQVSDTLKKLAASHPNPKAKKQAKLALTKLNEAQSAFGSASLCQGEVWGQDDT
jgi:hypothetical protein